MSTVAAAHPPSRYVSSADFERSPHLEGAASFRELVRLVCVGALFPRYAGVLWVRRRRGEPEQLARLLGAAETVRRTTGIAYTVSYRTRVELARDALQSRLGQEGFDAALAAGRSMPLNQLTALLDDALPVSASETVTPEPRSATILSPREQEVLHLVAEGRSNKQIARELIIAESTAKSYVTGVFNKLGVDTRAHAVAVAAQRGLLEPGDS